MNKTLKTKFGSCQIKNGYWKVSSRVEGNRDKLLHRLIFEDYYKVKLSKDEVIHHIDRNKLNNDISNLKLLSTSEHNSLHNSGENNCMYGKHHTKEVKQKISELNKNRVLPKRYNQSSANGLPFRVQKHKVKDYKKGFAYEYRYFENGKRKKLCSTSVVELHNKVKNKNLEWDWLNYNADKKAIK